MDTLAFLNLVFLTGISLFLTVLLFRGDFLKHNFVFYLPLSLGCHFIAAYIYWFYSVNGAGSDSLTYFYGANPEFGLNTGFAQFVSWYMRDLFWGDSFLAAFFFSAVIAYFGSLLYVLAFFTLLKRLAIKVDNRALTLPLLILLFWPTHLYFTAALVKDSGAYFCIALFTYALVSLGAFPLFKVFLLLLAGIIGFIIRPYLLIDFFLGAVLMLFFSSHIHLLKRLVLLLLGLALLVFCLDILLKMGGLSVLSLEGITGRLVENQILQNTGTSIPVPSTNPIIMFLCLPYLFLANLLLPLFIFANNLVGLLASVENCIFIALCYYGFKHRQYWKRIKQSIPELNFLFYFSLSGIAFMSLMNTNLGLAMREKVMFVPIFLLVICCIMMLHKAERAQERGDEAII